MIISTNVITSKCAIEKTVDNQEQNRDTYGEDIYDKYCQHIIYEISMTNLIKAFVYDLHIYYQSRENFSPKFSGNPKKTEFCSDIINAFV